MATKKVKEVNSKVITYDSGKYQLRVEWKGQLKGGFKFRPRLVIKDGFKSSHTATFSWSDHTKKAAKQNTKDSDDNTVFKTTTTEVKYKHTVKSKGSTYASTKKNKKTGKTTGKWFTNYDGKVTIKCKVGNGTVSISIDHRDKPFAPENITVAKVGALDEHLQITVGRVKAKPYAPVRYLDLYRLDNSGTEGDYRRIASKTFGNADSGGDINGITNIVFDDQTTEKGNRYKYKVVAVNSYAPAGRATTTNWYYTSPPEVTNVSHHRIADTNETQNAVSFSRNDDDVDHGYYKGFLVQYSNSLPTDPDSKQTWSNLGAKGTDYKFYDPLNPSVEITQQNFSWLTTKYSNGRPVGNNILFRHITCRKDRTYRYRIRPWNYFEDGRKKNSKGQVSEPAVYSDEAAPSLAGTDVTYNEPYPPEKVTATFNTETGFVDLEVFRKEINTTADKMYIQRKEDDDWEDVPYGASDGIDITPKTNPPSDYDDRKYTYTDEDVPTGSADEIIYRVALGCTRTPADGTTLRPGNGKSDWTESNPVIIISKPNPPTLIMPVNNGYSIIDDTFTKMAWIHSPTDGTEQEAAIINYVKGTFEEPEGEIQEISVEAVSYYNLDISGFQSGDKISWRVQTKGKHVDYSDWSEVYTLMLYAKPSIEWSSPANYYEVTNLPLDLEWRYSDDAGTLSDLKLQIWRGSELEATYALPTSLNDGIGQYSLKEFLFEDEDSYQLVLVSQSSIGLSSSDRLNIDVRYVSIFLANGYEPDASFDEDTGIVYVTVSKILTSQEEETDVIAIDGATAAESEEMTVDDDLVPEEATVVSATITKFYLYRVANGKRTLVTYIDSADTGSMADSYEFEDLYAPVNIDFEYEVLQITSNGEVAISEATMNFYSTWWYIYYGDGDIVKARWNPTGSAQFRRPEKQQIRYSGREYPVTYDSNANEETYSFSMTLFRDLDDGRDVLEQFKDMVRSGGSGVWKSFEGDVYPADFDFSYSSDYTDGIPSWQCSLNVTRIDTEEAL